MYFNRSNGNFSSHNTKQNPDIEKTEILVADKDLTFLSILSTQIRSEGFICHAVENGLEALKSIVRNNQIGIVILNEELPIFDGYEIFDLLKESEDLILRDVQVIMMIKPSQFGNIIDQAKNKMDFLIVKPFGYKTLSQKLTTANYKFQLNCGKSKS